MKSVLIATKNITEARELELIIRADFNVFIINSPKEIHNYLEKVDLVLLDYNFTDKFGIDIIVEILTKIYLPILILTPHDAGQIAVAAIRVGAYNYIVKIGDFKIVLNISIKEAIGKFSEREQMKQTIAALKKRIGDMETRLGNENKEETRTEESKPISKINIVEEIIARFKRGDINLPSLPQISIKFREMIEKGANLKDVSELLKQDMAISSKLISVSNSPFYRSVIEHKTLEQAINRLGLSVTRQYVEVISNRALYTINNKKYVDIIEKLWEHSLSCAYAAQITNDLINLKLQGDAFTMGLLHDIGKLVLLQVIGEIEIKNMGGQAVGRIELFKTIDSFHGKFGSAILRRWDFSNTFAQIAICHDDLMQAETISKDILLIHFANLLVKSMGYDLAKGPEIQILNIESTKLLKIDSATIKNIKNQLKDRMEELKKSLG